MTSMCNVCTCLGSRVVLRCGTVLALGVEAMVEGCSIKDNPLA